MDNSEQQARIISLGKQFVDELGLDPGVDTFSKWMAHYLAEKMTLLEQLPPGENKKATEKECFEVILKLWKHRWTLPSGKRPLENFEPILRVLKRLDPEIREPFLYRHFENEMSDTGLVSPEVKEAANHVAIAVQIDKVARSWIEFILQQAGQKAKSGKTVLFRCPGIRPWSDGTWFVLFW